MNINNRLSRMFIKSFSCNRSYEALGLEIKKLCNINNIVYINKNKTVALESARVIRVILYLFFDIIYGIMKFLLFIS
jgi:hypothetical protein